MIGSDSDTLMVPSLGNRVIILCVGDMESLWCQVTFMWVYQNSSVKEFEVRHILSDR